ncbi:MAG: hypothetical protein WCJ19_03130 [bacterium]
MKITKKALNPKQDQFKKFIPFGIGVGLLLLVVISLLFVTNSTAIKDSRFGLSAKVNSENDAKLLRSLGATYFLPSKPIILSTGNMDCSECDYAKNAGMKLVIQIVNSYDKNSYMSEVPKDLDTYKNNIEFIISKYSPELIVVEQEENNNYYYKSTASEYQTQLKVACDVAHSKGIKCTNGGLTDNYIGFDIYVEFMKEGRLSDACNLANFVFTSPEQIKTACNVKNYEEAGKFLTKLNKEAAEFIDLYKNENIDYLNTHWYTVNSNVLETVSNFLKEKTGKTVITTQVSQNEIPIDVFTTFMKKSNSMNMPVVIWESIDNERSKSFIDKNGQVLEKGDKFRSEIKSY